MIDFFLQKSFKRFHIKFYRPSKFFYSFLYKYSFLYFNNIIIFNFYKRLYYLYNILKLIYILLKKKKNIFNIFFLFDKKYLCFKYLKNKKFIIRYYKKMFWNVFNEIDIIININNIISKNNIIIKKNIPLISFSSYYIFDQKYCYSFICLESNINKIYIFYLFLLLG